MDSRCSGSSGSWKGLIVTGLGVIEDNEVSLLLPLFNCNVTKWKHELNKATKGERNECVCFFAFVLFHASISFHCKKNKDK